MIAVAGGKGGSGKTTTTLGLARALSRRGAPVVAADADWDLPNLARLASATDGDREPAADAPTVVDAIRTEGQIRPDRRAPTVLSAPDEPADVDARRILGALAESVPDDSPTLLDCPAGASPDAAAPLRVADRCLLATPLRRAALRDAAKTAALARRLDCLPVGVVAVRAESVPTGVGDLLGCPVLGRIPPAEAEPLASSAVRSAYDDLARRLVDEHGADRWRVA
ncbi:MinD/ParA family ATP-binding protein [Halorubrum lacusprofundi]|uniref:Cell division inhibitor MinD-like (ATPase involved in chromosome partitioning) n=1 Tax=Halorubrum lacusprofundi (strain ATCC 49239 / DSM 5036 / JCM 8891 / ACAM 34) TaxID=416348 RepID=B9LUT1_HALLT|nr:P-loop NTPase [Halorubrum lacusprofundi]ACM56408.1 cell division inhibitor MinD-like (ATPase involved in chromosome partitioning) [Halorubrum lacusprofundi ATCC 49239]